MRKKCKNSNKKLLSVTLLSIINSWESTGLGLIKLKRKSRFKSKNKICWEINRSKKKRRLLLFPRKNYPNLSISWSNKQISYLTIRWERSWKKPARRKNLNKSYNCSKRPYLLTQCNNLTFLLTKWQTGANTSAKRRSTLSSNKN